MSAFIETKNKGFLVLTDYKTNEPILVSIDKIIAIEKANNGITFVSHFFATEDDQITTYGSYVVESVGTIAKLLSQKKE